MQKHIFSTLSATNRHTQSRPIYQALVGCRHRPSHISTTCSSRSIGTCTTIPTGSILIGRHVREALSNGCPVVALESTVITHGLPEPQNLELALKLEHEIYEGLWWCNDRRQLDDSSCVHGDQDGYSSVRDHHHLDQTSLNPMKGSVVPATVGIIKGQLVVGLTRDEIEFLANLERSRPIKASRRDIPVAQALHLSAGTTVSATMALATSCRYGSNRISVFATGGLGGVHLGGERSMDISADLYEMARSPIGLVSSGFKSFLDTRLSLEVLETFGCTVTSMRPFEQLYSAQAHFRAQAPESDMDRADDNLISSSASQRSCVKLKTSQPFPGFFTAVNKERVRSPWQCDSVQEAARILYHCIRDDGRPPALNACVQQQQQQRGSHSKSGATYQITTDNNKIWRPSSSPSSSEARWLRNGRAMLLACPIPGEFSLEDSPSTSTTTTTTTTVTQGPGAPPAGGGVGGGEQYSRELLDRISDEIGQRQDLSGNERTPLILAELNRLTGGKTLKANLELLRNNARVGAHLAYEHSGLCQRIGGASILGVATSLDEHDDDEDGHNQQQQPGCAENIDKRAHEKEKEGGQCLGWKKAISASEPDDPAVNRAIRSQKTQAAASSMGELGNQEVSQQRQPVENRSPLVVGCTMIDMHVRTKVDDRFKANPAHSGVTFEGEPRMVLGGVGRNLAAALELLGHMPTFITSLASDNLGEFARNELLKLLATANKCTSQSATKLSAAAEKETDELPIKRFKILEWKGRRGEGALAEAGESSSSCFALVLIDSLTGHCEFVIANLEARHALSRDNLGASSSAKASLQLEEMLFERASARPPLIVLDANVPADTLDYMFELGHRWRVPVFLEPTDVNCLPELVGLLKKLRAEEEDFSSSGSNYNDKNNHRHRLKALEYMSPNVIELETMLRLFQSRAGQPPMAAGQGALTMEQIETMARELMELHLPDLGCLLVTMDKRGLLIGLRTSGQSSEQLEEMRLLQHNRDSSSGSAAPAPTDGPAPGTPTQSLVFRHYSPLETIESPVSASGAGDCFAAGFISGLINDLHLSDCVELGFRASGCALMDRNTVPESLIRLRKRVVK